MDGLGKEKAHLAHAPPSPGGLHGDYSDDETPGSSDGPGDIMNIWSDDGDEYEYGL